MRPYLYDIEWILVNIEYYDLFDLSSRIDGITAICCYHGDGFGQWLCSPVTVMTSANGSTPVNHSGNFLYISAVASTAHAIKIVWFIYSDANMTEKMFSLFLTKYGPRLFKSGTCMYSTKY